MSAVPSGLTKVDLDLAHAMWKAGVISEKISEKLCISNSSFASLRLRRRDLFPLRPHGGEKARVAVQPAREPRTDSGKFAQSFLPLPSCQPVPFALSTGCSWPVYGEAINPLDSPVATHVCGQRRLVRGDKVESYCAVHYRLAYSSRAA